MSTNQIVMSFPKLFECVQQLFCCPRQRIMLAALSFDLDHQNHVLKQHNGISKFLPFLHWWIPVHKITKKRALKEPLTPFFYIIARLAPNFWHVGHPTP